jgi:NADH-quinone oxidoreductase subunit M
MPFISGCFIVGCMASIGMPGTVNFIAEIMIIVGSWEKYPLQVIVAVLGIVLTMAYLLKMMRSLFYGPMNQQYSHAHDAVSIVDRLPLLVMIAVSVGFGIFPMHLYDVVRSGVDPLVARITHVVPVAQSGDGLELKGEATIQPASRHVPLVAINPVPLTPHPSRGNE